MASKKKQRGGKPRAKTRPKTKTKVKAQAKVKAKAGAKKAKAGAKKKVKRAPARKPAPVATERSFPLIIDEVLEESLVDVSTVLRVKDKVARSQRDVDEDALKQFSDPSLVIEAQKPRREDEDTDESVLPELFAAEVRAQKARSADSSAQKRNDGSLFGSLGSDTPDDEPEED